MEASDLIKIKNQIIDLEEAINDLKSKVNSINIDRQFYLTAEDNLLPGKATKVIYNKDGLIIRGEKLDKVDIPNLDIDHINGLRELLNDKISKSEMSRFRSIVDQSILKKGTISDTGIKINYDENGLIISSSDLLPEDIPNIPIDKIDGLKETLETISSEAESSIEENIEHPNISSNTFPKVTYDEHGHITQGEKLTIDDMPQDIITHLNEIDSKLLNAAQLQTVKRIENQIQNKVNSNPLITAGTYTKVRVDSKGLIIGSSELNEEDLPQSLIQNIENITQELKNKADHSELSETNALAANIIEKLPALNNILSLQNDVKKKANSEEVSELKNNLSFIKNLVERTIEKAPLDMITPQFAEINNKLNNLEGRIAAIEFKLNNE